MKNGDPASGEVASPRKRLLNRDFVLLWQGQLVSQLGNQAFTVAMMIWLQEKTGSATLVGLAGMISSLPVLLIAPLGGALADRYSRRKILIGCDLLRGVAVLFLALWASLFAESPATVVPVLLAVALLNGVFSAIFLPALGAAIPDLVPAGRVAAANSLRQISNGSVTSLGQAAGGFLFQILGAPLLFLIDGLTFLLSGLSEVFIDLPHHQAQKTLGLRQTIAAYGAATREGLLYAWGRPGVVALLATAAGLNFFLMPIFVLMPFYAAELPGRSATTYGLLMAATSAGNLAGSALAGALKARGATRSRLMLTCLVLLPPSFAGLAVVRRLDLAILCLIVAGILFGMFNVLEVTLFQISTPSHLRGRLMSLILATSRAISPLGMALGGLLGDLTGKSIPALFLALAASTLVITLVAVTRPALRRLLAWEAPPAQE